MPVIQLPRDDRWGQLGAGLGSLLSGVVQAVQQRQAQQGVAQIWSDPSVPDDQKLIQSLKQYGDVGGQVGLQLLKAKTLQQQLQDISSQTEQRRSASKVSEARAALMGAQAPFVPQLEQAKIGETQAKTAAELGRLPLQQAQTEEARAKTALTAGPEMQAQRQLGGLRAAETEKAQVQTDIDKFTRDRMAATMKPGAAADQHPLDAALAAIPSLPDDQKEASRQIYNGVVASGGKPDAAARTALSYAEKQVQQTIPPADIRKEVAAKAEGAEALKIFMDAFEASPKTGLFTGAPFKAWLEGKGAASGDAPLLRQYDTSLRATADNLSAGGMGGGFMSAIRLKFAKDLAPGLMDSPLRNLINVDVMADTTLAKLRADKANMPDKVIQKGLDQVIANWEDVKKITAAYQTYITPKGQTVLTHNGSALDPKDFSVKIDANRLYKAQGEGEYKGSDIVARAQANNMGPVEYARQVQINLR